MEYTILCDTREQNPLWKTGVEIGTLKTGDYSIVGHADTFALERKSLPDLFGTLTSGHARFKKEIERAKRDLKYFAIIIEGTYKDVETKNFDGAHFVKTHGYIINKILMTLHIKYGVNVFFCRDRAECKALMRGLMVAYLTNEAKNENKINIAN